MSEKKHISYEAGHKRETRKSYQSFLEELMSDPSEETSGSDDASVRRSRRTPVPKRGFKLIDDYDSKESSAKKKFKKCLDENNEEKLKPEGDEEYQEVKVKEEVEDQEAQSEDAPHKNSEDVPNRNSEDAPKKNIEDAPKKNIEDAPKKNCKTEQTEEQNNSDEPGGSGSSTARKSGRARKPKTFEDSIMPIKRYESKKPTELVTSDLSDAETEVLKKKVLLKLTANTPIGIKEEKIIGKDNVEYLYRNVFVTEILDSKRKRTCRLSKDNETKEDSDKTNKSISSDPNKDKDKDKESNKDAEIIVDIKKKKEPKLKSTPDKTVSTKSSKSPNQNSEIVDSKKRKSASVEKERESHNDKKEFKKSNELDEINIKRTTDTVDTKKKRTSTDKLELKKASEHKRTSIETSDSDIVKEKTSNQYNEEIQHDHVSKKKDKDLKHSDKKWKNIDEKKSGKSEVKKHVKFAEKEEIKLFEKDVHELDEKAPINRSGKKINDEKLAFHCEMIPTLADSVKQRRKNKKTDVEDGAHASPNLADKQQATLGHHDSKKNKRKISKDDEFPSLTAKIEVKEQKSPSKSDKGKSTKDKESEKPTKESKKSLKSHENIEKSEIVKISPKKDSVKSSSSKKKLSPTGKKEKTNDVIQERPVENFEPSPKKKKSKSKHEPVSIIGNECLVNGIKEELPEEAPIVLTFKSSDITNISPPKKEKHKNHVYDKTSTKISKKTEIKKNKKQNKKKKLIVSFKNNQSFQPKRKKKSIEKEEPVDTSPVPSSLDTSSDSSKLEQITPEVTPEPPPIILPETTTDILPASQPDVHPDEDDEDVKHKKKSKKKSKTKLKKHQKLVNVETFTVSDQTVVKVKKKKIYKNRNGEKVLIRLIKNHCNKNGDIVKTETIVVDNDSPPIDEEKEKNNASSQVALKAPSVPEKSTVKSEVKKLDNKVPEKIITEKTITNKASSTKEGKEKKVSDKRLSEKKTEKKVTEKKTTEKKNTDKVITENTISEKGISEKKAKEESPEYFPHLNNDTTTSTKLSTKRKSKFKHSSDSKSSFKSEKRPIFKKTQKILKKPLSRPANKNVTVGGKVVGKTTKGMKKTGGDNIEPPAKISVKNTVFEPITPELPATVPVTEPKNVYNFFCRKYRPIVVQQFPKADFSEISRRLAALWKTLSETERQDQRDKFEELHSVSQQKLAKLGRLSPTMWSESDLKFIKKNIAENESYSEVFAIPKYPVKRLSPIDMAAHLSLLGDSLNVISGALQQQSSMTVHGAMSVLLDSILSALAPLVFFTSHIPEMKAIDDAQQARILDNLAYILPGL